MQMDTRCVFLKVNQSVQVSVIQNLNNLNLKGWMDSGTSVDRLCSLDIDVSMVGNI